MISAPEFHYTAYLFDGKNLHMWIEINRTPNPYFQNQNPYCWQQQASLFGLGCFSMLLYVCCSADL